MNDAMVKLQITFTKFEADIISYFEPRIKGFDDWLASRPTTIPIPGTPGLDINWQSTRGLPDQDVDHHEHHTSQTNTIHVIAPDPHTAAAMVGLHVDRNAADLARNMQGAASLKLDVVTEMGGCIGGVG
jgi:hypothetical protein